MTEAQGLIERVRALTLMIAQHAQTCEQQRQPVDEVMQALAATGVFKAHVPRRFGGYEIDLATFIDIGIAVSEACTSTGWVTSFYIEHNWMLSQFSPTCQEAVFSKQPYILAPASISPSGQASAVDGGYRLSGRWAWGTGIVHADWVLLSGLVKQLDGPPDMRLFLIPREQIQVDETWNSAGMEGTGSHDMLADDVFVSADFSESSIAMGEGRGQGAAWHDSPCYRHPMMPLLSLAAGTPALGAARRAVALFTERLKERVLFGTGSKQAQRSAAQNLLGQSAVRVQSAETLLHQVGQQLARWGEAEQSCPPQERARLRLQVAQVVHSCRSVVQDLMLASGASAHMRTHPMQRVLRDVQTLSCHTIFDLDVGGENYGCTLLDIPPSAPIL